MPLHGYLQHVRTICHLASSASTIFETGPAYMFSGTARWHHEDVCCQSGQFLWWCFLPYHSFLP